LKIALAPKVKTFDKKSSKKWMNEWIYNDDDGEILHTQSWYICLDVGTCVWMGYIYVV
jgi:hypothetical protein